MGVSLGYVSSSPVDDQTKAAIRADADTANDSHTWWCEGITFYDNDHKPDYLTGDSKLFLLGYSTDDGEMVEVDPADDCFMAARDARRIVERLCEWSNQYGVDWELDVEGGPVGQVIKGKPSSEFEGFLSSLPLIAMADSDDPDALLAMDEPDSSDSNDDQRAAAIDKKYASRWP